MRGGGHRVQDGRVHDGEQCQGELPQQGPVEVDEAGVGLEGVSTFCWLVPTQVADEEKSPENERESSTSQGGGRLHTPVELTLGGGRGVAEHQMPRPPQPT